MTAIFLAIGFVAFCRLWPPSKWDAYFSQFFCSFYCLVLPNEISVYFDTFCIVYTHFVYKKHIIRFYYYRINRNDVFIVDNYLEEQFKYANFECSFFSPCPIHFCSNRNDEHLLHCLPNRFLIWSLSISDIFFLKQWRIILTFSSHCWVDKGLQTIIIYDVTSK